MTARAFVVLLLVTVFAIWVGDSVAREYAAPGLERTFAVLVVAAFIVAPAAWLLEKLGWIRKGAVDFAGRRSPTDTVRPRDGGAA
ncbi:MAG: hypothetical protein RJA99_2672 [Pseudomonadota bacterium]|jgi:hypothetical protein